MKTVSVVPSGFDRSFLMNNKARKKTTMNEHNEMLRLKMLIMSRNGDEHADITFALNVKQRRCIVPHPRVQHERSWKLIDVKLVWMWAGCERRDKRERTPAEAQRSQRSSHVWRLRFHQILYRGHIQLLSCFVSGGINDRAERSTVQPLLFICAEEHLFMFFYRLLTWMVFERPPNCNDYKLIKKLRDLSPQKRNRMLLPQRCIL